MNREGQGTHSTALPLKHAATACTAAGLSRRSCQAITWTRRMDLAASPSTTLFCSDEGISDRPAELAVAVHAGAPQPESKRCRVSVAQHWQWHGILKLLVCAAPAYVGDEPCHCGVRVQGVEIDQAKPHRHLSAANGWLQMLKHAWKHPDSCQPTVSAQNEGFGCSYLLLLFASLTFSLHARRNLTCCRGAKRMVQTRTRTALHRESRQ